jgi:hypothetical protein
LCSCFRSRQYSCSRRHGGSQAEAQEASTKFDPAVRPEFHEPVTLASKDGVLEVRLIAK